MSTTILRNSTIPAAFKYKVEEKAPTFVHPATGETIQVQIGLNPDPVSNGNSSVDTFGALMMACANAMASSQFKNKDKSALVFNKADNGEIIAAVISSYDEDGENYFYNFTFNPEDVKGIKNIVNYKDFVDEQRNITFPQLVNAAYCAAHNIAISDYGVLDVLIISALECIYQWLDTNAKDGEVVELVIDDYIGRYDKMTAEQYQAALVPVAIATVETVKDVKKMSIQFSEELKAIAKGSNDMQS